MKSVDNKNQFAKNLQYYMDVNKKSRTEVAEAIGVSYYTFTSWVTGKKYPRMDKVERMANYFGILKSDLIEKRTEEHRQMQQKNSVLTDLTIRMRTDSDFFSLIESLDKLDAVQLASIKQIADTFLLQKD